MHDLPFFRKQESALGKLLGGYSISAILTYHTGFPWTPVTGQSVSTPGGPTLSPTRPVAYFGGAGNDMSNSAFITGSNFAGGGAKYFDITRGGPPGIGRNSFRAPNLDQWDFSADKNFRIFEQARLQFRAEFFNLPNHTNFGIPNTQTTSAAFGTIRSTYPSRQGQFALKLIF